MSLAIDRRRALEVAIDAAREASALVMSVYAAPFDVEYKAKDDPVTRADREANALLCDRLSRAFPGVPLVAEESDPASYRGFVGADAAWFVDPLDGTREFVAKNGEFAVMLGLAERGRATLGVIAAPVWGRAFAGIVGEGAWEIGWGDEARSAPRTAIRVSTRSTPQDATVVVSRSRTTARAAELFASLGARPPRKHGSSGLKGVLVAIGEVDAYVQLGRAGMRWDACATEALVRAAGGACTPADGTPFDYAGPRLDNDVGLVASNGALHAALLEGIASCNLCQL